MNIKPGIIAFVVKSKAGNNGKIVEVVKCLGINAEYAGKKWNRDRVSWLCTSIGGPLTSSVGHEYTTMPLAQDQLKPIEPLDEDSDVLAKERAETDD